MTGGAESSEAGELSPFLLASADSPPGFKDTLPSTSMTPPRAVRRRNPEMLSNVVKLPAVNGQSVDSRDLVSHRPLPRRQGPSTPAGAVSA